MTTQHEGNIQAARIEAAALAILNDNPFNDEPDLWEVPSIRAHYTSIAAVALAAVDAVDPNRLRTITTVEELHALPLGSVIRDGDEELMEKTDNGWCCWVYVEGFLSSELTLPATVLHEPEAEATR